MAAAFFSSTPKCMAPSMVCAMQYWASRGSACDVSKEAVETAIDLALRIPDGSRHLRESLHHLGLALHDQKTVGNESQRLLGSFELLFQCRVCRKRRETWRRVGTLVHGRLFPGSHALMARMLFLDIL